MSFEKPPNLGKKETLKFSVEGTESHARMEYLQDFLEENGEVMNNILRELQERSGVEDTIDIPTNIVIDDSLPHVARAPMDDISKVEFGERFASDTSEHKGDEKENILPAYIHEALHQCSHMQQKDLLGHIYYSRSGYSQKTDYFKDNELSKTKGVLFNEAITETLALAIYDELLRRSGVAMEQHWHFRHHSYTEVRENLILLVDDVSVKDNIPSEDIWKALISNYFNGEIGIDQTLKLLQSSLWKRMRETDSLEVKEERRFGRALPTRTSVIKAFKQKSERSMGGGLVYGEDRTRKDIKRALGFAVDDNQKTT